jgi:hypothetical protein
MKYAEVITVALEDDRQLAEPGYSITANSLTYILAEICRI